MTRRAPFVLAMLAFVAGCGDAPREKPARASHGVAARAPAQVVYRDVAASLGVVVLAHAANGRPRRVRAVDVPSSGFVTAEDAARAHLARLRPLFGDVTGTLAIDRSFTLPSGLHVVVFAPEIDGLRIGTGEVRVLMREGLELLLVTGTPPDAPLGRDVTFRLDARDASTRASIALVGPSPNAVVHATERLLALRGGELVPAYRLSLTVTREGTTAEGFVVDVDARDGEVIAMTSVTANDTFTYTVFADDAPPHTPFEGPETSTMPHPTGVPDGSRPSFVMPRAVNVEGLITVLASPDPWLPDGATVTTGNNADAYADLESPDGFTEGLDFRASVTSPGVFAHTYDTSLGALDIASQRDAAVTQLFFTINWLHDAYYDAGFTETAWNAQTDSYGRGGLGGDAIFAEAQDAAIAGARNNANMTTFVDGVSPRMQVYLWDGRDTRTLTITSGVGELAASTASFGAAEYDVSADIALAEDASGVATTDACEPIINDVAGKVVLVDRGTCLFVEKAANVQAAGGVAMIVVNNVVGNVSAGMSGTNAAVTIPCIGIGNDDGQAVRTAVNAQATSAHLFRDTEPLRDAALDGSIIAHEWGHYLHHRLSACEFTKQCRALSEGWADFVALHMGLREGDALDGAYPIAAYADVAGSPDHAYFGLRRAPYSVDRTKNDLSFRHIARGEPLPTHPLSVSVDDNAAVHNAGEVWASMLFDALVALVRAHGVEEGRRRMAEYVVAGLIATAPQATYVDAREGLLDAVGAVDEADALTIATSFAARGLGSCAVAPPASSDDLTGVVESTTSSARFVFRSVGLVDDTTSCDADGVLDAGESGHVEVGVANVGAMAASVVVRVTSQTPELVVDAPFAESVVVAPFTSTTVRLPVSLANSVADVGIVELWAELTQSAGCVVPPPFIAHLRTNADDVPSSSRVETFKSRHTAFTEAGTQSFDLRVDRTSLDVEAFTRYDARTDASLVTPSLTVGTDAFTVMFVHRYAFETDGAAGPGLDGGVVELSLDHGETWADATSRAAVAYTGAIADTALAARALRGRAAFVGRSPGYPLAHTTTIDFGTSLSGQSVRLRFRFATNDNITNVGWSLDDVAFTGIVGTPFGEIVADRCGEMRDGGVMEDADVWGPDAAADAAAVPPAPGHLSGGSGCRASAQSDRGAWLALVVILAGIRYRPRRGAPRAA